MYTTHELDALARARKFQALPEDVAHLRAIAQAYREFRGRCGETVDAIAGVRYAADLLRRSRAEKPAPASDPAPVARDVQPVQTTTRVRSRERIVMSAFAAPRGKPELRPFFLNSGQTVEWPK